jgi:diaminohydroxyphosphoribosylaminopyrimidine deaminase/5-amino-6-(5-phosphoribosylamino)uracil reductase
VTETTAMLRALDLAYRGWGRVHPNPLVGAVVLSGETVVGEGFHAEFGGPHAEAVALEAAGDRANGATLVVNLEPCIHTAKQPPCVDLIVAKGIKRVVAAMPDPNPPAAGGADRLRAAGVEVVLGPCREDAERQNAVYLRAHEPIRRPFVTLKLATSLDHRIADQSGVSRWISGDAARDYVHWLRAGYEAIGVGGRTALMDNPSLTVRGEVEPRLPPTRVVFLGSRRLPLDAHLVRTAGEIPTMVVVDALFQFENASLAAFGVEIVPAADLADAMEELWARGIRSIIIEGGGRLAGSLLARGLVDRFVWVVSPVWLGDRGVPAIRGYDVASLLVAERWTTIDRKSLGQDTVLVFDKS